MSKYKYLNELRTEELIDEIKSRLNVRISQVKIMHTPREDELDKIVQYVGVTNANYINGYFYKCVSDGGVTPAYSWEKIQVSDGGDTIQVETLPTASADELGNIYEFVGTTTANYINGRFYRCVSDGASTPTYSWEEVDFGDGTPHWSGTRAEYEAIKNTLEAGTYVSITDDYDEGLEVVDVVEEDNMNPVTSNAVAELLDTVDTIPVTTNNNFVPQTINCKKAGRIIILNFRGRMNDVALSTDANNGTLLGSIPVAYAPKSNVSNMIQGWDGILRKTALTVDNYGNIWSYGEISTNNQYMWGQVSWVFED